MTSTTLLFKDSILSHLANDANVAQFVSFSPELVQRHSAIVGFPIDHQFGEQKEAVTKLLDRSPDGKVNLRTFLPHSPEGNEFIFGLGAVDEVLGNLERLASRGLYVIVNETVDINDGGVSGVICGQVLECAPDATPRCVEEPDVAMLPSEVGRRIIRTIYGGELDLPCDSTARIEFSVHPKRRGFRSSRVLIWERRDENSLFTCGPISWPNRFSRFLGDKLYGLLVAHSLGFLVPNTVALCRRVAPFSFGSHSRKTETWIRTCPAVPQPGRFTTTKGWSDPFAVMNADDRDGGAIPSILVQDGVESLFSGATLSSGSGLPIVEGVQGSGESLMLGGVVPSGLPEWVIDRVYSVHSELTEKLGEIRWEWAATKEELWVLQVQPEAAISEGRIIVPGEVEDTIDFDVSRGLEELRVVLAAISKETVGIRLVGNVGMTSHVADVLRRARVPSFLSTPR